MSFLPSVVHAEYDHTYRIRVTFNDGRHKAVDFEQWLKEPVFEPLREARTTSVSLRLATIIRRLR